MTFLYITIVLALALVSSIGIYRFFDYKETLLEYEKASGEQTTEISIKALQLEIEKENTRQMELNEMAFRDKNNTIKAKEETERLKIKSDYKEKHGERLY